MRRISLRLPLCASAAAVAAACLAASVTVQLIGGGDTLEPSVQNEVDHALARAPTNAPPCRGRADLEAALAGTNRIDATALAVRLVSSQRSDGRWLVGTNDATAVAVRLLERVSRNCIDRQ